MPNVYRAADRGVTQIDWLDSRHSFSFGQYYDPARMGFGPLRVINEDRVAPAGGFGTHGHANMEILTWVIRGELQHQDSLGNGSVIRAGELQRMSAGSGIRHSEFNASAHELVHFLQIWIQPDRLNVAPDYAQRSFAGALERGGWCLLASPDGSEGSISLRQNARVYAAQFAAGDAPTLQVAPSRLAWVQVVSGVLRYDGGTLVEGDGLALDAAATLEFVAEQAGVVIWFDLPA